MLFVYTEQKSSEFSNFRIVSSKTKINNPKSIAHFTTLCIFCFKRLVVFYYLLYSKVDKFTILFLRVLSKKRHKEKDKTAKESELEPNLLTNCKLHNFKQKVNIFQSFRMVRICYAIAPIFYVFLRVG